MQKLFRILFLALAWVLIVANSPAPPPPEYSITVHPDKQAGNVKIKIDPRMYQDKKFTITLPAGEYRSLRITTLVSDAKLSPEEMHQTIVEISREDPYFYGDPVRIEIDAEFVPKQLYTITVEDIQGNKSSLVFTVEHIVEEKG